MGSVSIDVSKKEREYREMTLSDINVVKYLILYRSKIDITYDANINIDINKAGDIFEFNQELISLYASLDSIIDMCNFKEKQLTLLRLIYNGHTLHDICNMNIGYGKSATYDLFSRMIDRIIKKNHELWKESMIKQGYIKEKEDKEG